ncbi:hypothetical protein [Streptomyces sp. ST2-7A]|uniref:hypothetical protein n=1 Tax=Streptomyces sp. ST2-7A TaxID=2907214 RepID=UPI001F3172CA|nr:hypothetical protein [Streptomyces sp. ST2-7A]MCE7081824.1 hypothetical protein [Streptomyces sp. ST2-7A]
MGLGFIGIDPETNGGNCPSVWVDEETGDLLLQGWEVTDPDTLTEVAARSPIAENERVVRLPARMRAILREACEDPEHG